MRLYLQGYGGFDREIEFDSGKAQVIIGYEERMMRVDEEGLSLARHLEAIAKREEEKIRMIAMCGEMKPQHILTLIRKDRSTCRHGHFVAAVGCESDGVYQPVLQDGMIIGEIGELLGKKAETVEVYSFEPETMNVEYSVSDHYNDMYDPPGTAWNLLNFECYKSGCEDNVFLSREEKDLLYSLLERECQAIKELGYEKAKKGSGRNLIDVM